MIERTAAYLQAGGTANMGNLVRFLADELLEGGLRFFAARGPAAAWGLSPALPREATQADWIGRHDPSRPTVGLLFYRAHWLSGNVEFVDAMVDAIEAAGIGAAGVHRIPEGVVGRVGSALGALARRVRSVLSPR